ncbi:MAG: NHLP bacteriocin system secretion protein [Proteobacteria bacterium]|nr:NHLP bacteriocin system secretion protein [Pseudomonadota bacterium]
MSEPKKRDIFRKEALEHLSSPERLDALFEVVTPRAWHVLATVGVGLFCVLVWSIFGHIPVTVEGTGIFVYPRRVVSFQAPASGQVVTFAVNVGDFVEKGTILGTLNQPELVKQLEQERVRLAEARAQGTQQLDVFARRMSLERDAIARKRSLLNERIDSLRTLTENQKARNQRYLEQQRANLAAVRDTQAKLGAALQDRLASYERLRKEGLSSDDSVLQARQSFIGNQVERADLDLRAQEIEIRRLEYEQSYQSALDRIDGYRTELQELDIQEKNLQQQELETSSGNAQRVAELERNVARIEAQIASRGQILSEHAGRILELNVGGGQFVDAGQRLGSMATEDHNARMEGIAYFAVERGKQVQKGMSLRITPRTVQRERFGSIEATVREVSAFPLTMDAVANTVGNTEVAQELTEGRSMIQVMADLGTDQQAPSGYKWTSGRGPADPVTSGTTAEVRVAVEFRRPLSFLIPLLKKWTGVG